MSVLQMTPDQINALDQTQQQSVMQLVRSAVLASPSYKSS